VYHSSKGIYENESIMKTIN